MILKMCNVRQLKILLSPKIIKYNKSYSTIETKDIRNIGIIAHVDAGKTTTTERMLFYSGKTNTLGEVHHGNTVTDFLSQERERGITICSSSVTFPWNKHKINIIDTPGHIDFTMEVEQSLNAVDGVIIVLDGSAGVEAQTLTVWSQSDRHKLPKIVFINKMDRQDSDLLLCLKDIKNKFDIQPISLHHSIKDQTGFIGLIDIIELKKIIWNQETLGRDYTCHAIENELKPEILEKRCQLIDELSTFDDNLAESIIINGNYDNISNELIWNAVKKATLEQKIVPVLIGSAYKNIGVQVLMDAVIKFLPAPNERQKIYNCFGNDFVGKVFKIVHDKQKGALTLVRVFSGNLKKGMRLISGKGTSETLQKVYEPLADEYREISGVIKGDIGVCSGLKNTTTGDLLVSNTNSLKIAETKLDRTNDGEIDSDTILLNPKIPDAVYFCSIEPPSLSYQNALENALKQLQREDPSLRVNYDETTGQTVLGGMGELHMEIIKARILSEYKIDADLGPLQIAYKETLETSMEFTWQAEKEIAGSKQCVIVTMSLNKRGKEIFSLDNSPENAANLNSIRPKNLQLIKKGALAALERGPRIGGEVIDTKIKLHNIQIHRGTADSFLTTAASQCVQKILIKAGTRLLEPIMSIQIVLPSEKVSTVLADLSRRRAIINDVKPRGESSKIILVVAPLAELSGYSTALRKISSGQASVTMQPNGYANMNLEHEEQAVRRAQGLD